MPENALTGLQSEADEQALIEAAQRDPRRFGELYERNFERVYAFVARRVRNRAVAEDLTSTVFHRALESLPRFEWRGVPFAAWLLRIARNAVADHWQRAAREQGNPGREEAEDEMGLEEIEQRATLFRLVRDLPADQRRVVVERFVEQRSLREIAQALGRSEGAVKQLQFRALAKLRTRMSETHG
ncbi:MAG: sigma-70 family RNA polymerase sigma factor [Acidobacteria bacterium]|nr:sigma-70 family RNA polymerase sigma factor [Acidobacteriota bacterium]